MKRRKGASDAVSADGANGQVCGKDLVSEGIKITPAMDEASGLLSDEQRFARQCLVDLIATLELLRFPPQSDSCLSRGGG